MLRARAGVYGRANRPHPRAASAELRSSSRLLPVLGRLNGLLRPVLALGSGVLCRGRRLQLHGHSRSELMVAERFLDVLGAGGSDALVDGERLPQMVGGFDGVAVVQVAVADSFQCACLL